MKKLLQLTMLSLPFLANAQLQNSSFENWQNPITDMPNKPVGWIRTNGDPMSEEFDFPFQNLPITTSQHGEYALRLSVWYGFDKDMAVQTVPITSRPEALTGYYTYTDELIFSNTIGYINDEAEIAVYLTKWNAALSQNDTIGTGRILLGAVNNYTAFHCPVTYTSDAIPDTVRIVLNPSANVRVPGPVQFMAADLNVSSILTIDNLVLVETMGDENFENNTIKVYPNPASDIISISGFDGHAELFDATGKKILSQHYGNAPINISGLQQGIYLLRLDDGKEVTASKIIKQ
ncbi:T9SS type A sorting domain-containing protein [Flavobacterium sp.]|uniref:T9SS type A sorting domain-containing protein n=1 Tax=Flavobacterium sp. TaxID=239 RepID=UPI0040337F6E